ncbi:hypothetical protein ACFX14_029161 [Malus domestica]
MSYEGRVPAPKLQAYAGSAPTIQNWLFDSGANAHITNDPAQVTNARPYHGTDQVNGVVGGTGLNISHVGNTCIRTPQALFQLPNTLLCPNASTNIISIHRFTTDNNCSLTLFPHAYRVQDLHTGKMLFHGRSNNGFYPFSTVSSCTKGVSAFIGARVSNSIWHSRLGHPSFHVLQSLISSNKLPINGVVTRAFCQSCPLGKSHKLPFRLSNSKSSFPLQLVHSDVWTSPTVSINGFKYYVVFIDDFSRYSWLYPLKFKSDVFSTFVAFKKLVENMFNTTIKSFQTDGGGEYLSNNFKAFLTHHGIHHRLSCPHHPEQNGISERKHRHLVETGLTLLAHSSFPTSFWDDAFHTANYLINRLPTKVLHNDSPFQKLFHKSPQYDFLKVFGCACFPYFRPYNSNKLQFRSKRCVFLGYSLNHQGYKCLDMSTGKIFVSHHVVFDETCFPYKESITPVSPSPTISTDTMTLDIGPSLPYRPQSPPIPPNPTPPPLPSTVTPTPTPPLILPIPTPPISTPLAPTNASHIPSTSSSSQRILPPTHSMTTRAKDGIHKPNPKYAFTSTVTNLVLEPTCFTQANKSPEWRQAMAEEFTALLRTGTWSLVPFVPSMNVLPNKWVYRIKRHSDGSIQRYKARLVANGYHQQDGIDYDETFSPVVTHATIRLVLSVALHFNWPITQLDVQNAFLHGSLAEVVYMRQPVGFVDSQFPNHVCRLHKSLYGLKQAPRAWFQCFSHHLEDLGFQASLADSSLFTYFNGSTVIYLLIYVDDILVTGNNPSHISQLIQQLGQKFSMKDLGPLHYFLGMEIQRTPTAMYLTQSKYILDLLKKTNMCDAKPLTTPATTGRKLSLFEGEPLSDGTLFRSIVGALQYLLFTRPDIAFAVNQVCQYMHSPTTTHWTAVKRILRYLKATPDHGIVYKPSSLTLTAFADADYAGDPDDRRSTGGYCIFLGHNLVSWSSKKQRGVSRSSTEAEYRQLAYTAATLSWFRHIFRDLHLSLSPPRLWCDNISALAVASNPVYQARMRHVEVDYHYVREKVVRKELQVGYVATADQIADFLTKGLSSPRFRYLLSKLPVRPRPLRLRGRDKPTFPPGQHTTPCQQSMQFDLPESCTAKPCAADLT